MGFRGWKILNQGTGFVMFRGAPLGIRYRQMLDRHKVPHTVLLGKDGDEFAFSLVDGKWRLMLGDAEGWPRDLKVAVLVLLDRLNS